MGYRSLSLSAYERKLRADKKLSNEERGNYFDAMAKLMCLAQDHKVRLLWSARAKAIYWTDHDAITLPRISLTKTIVHDLLHELGHVELRNKHRFRMNDGTDSKTVQQQLNMLNEEFEAWYTGKKIAKRLKCVIDLPMLERSEKWALMRYVTWAARRGSKQKRWV